MFQSNTGPYKMTGIETVRYRSITGPYNGPVQAQNDRNDKRTGTVPARNDRNGKRTGTGRTQNKYRRWLLPTCELIMVEISQPEVGCLFNENSIEKEKERDLDHIQVSRMQMSVLTLTKEIFSTGEITS